MRPRTALGAWLSCGLLVACTGPPPVEPTEGHAPSDPGLEGVWEGGDDAHDVRVTIEGDSLHFYEREDFQYDTTFVVVAGSDPPELHATILDSPRTTDSVGEVVVAIYTLEGDTLDLAAVDKADGEPASFEETISRYQLERVRAPE